MIMRFLTVLGLAGGLLAATAAFAADEAPASLPVPRFVSLGTDEVNLRTGPGLRYPIKLVMRRDGLPVEVIREFDVWRQVRDVEGDEGWVHKSMLSGRRNAVLRGSVQPIYRKADSTSRPVARLEPGVVATIAACQTDTWCQLKVASYKGWIKKEHIWGVYPDEKIEE